ncbi:MAG: KEOPS complex subunit Pcc1 [Candidatus Njordarchaeales archaeon]
MPENENTSRMEARAVIEISTNYHFLKAIFTALKPETKSLPTERSKSTISFNETERLIRIEIITRDLTSLRASINSYFRWLSAVINSLKVIKDVQPGRKS